MTKIYMILGFLLGCATAVAQGDACADAVSVHPGNYTADGPATGGGAINTDGSGNADWYSFTASCDGTIDVSACLGGEDTDLFIYEAACPAAPGAAPYASNDDSCPMFIGSSDLASQLSNVSVVAGTTYYFEWGDQWSSNPFDWSLAYNSALQYTPIVSNTTSGGADFSWAQIGAETSWFFEFGIAGFIQGSGTVWTVTGTADSVLTGLAGGTTYDVYITATDDPCTQTLFTFTTDLVCPPPTLPNSTPDLFDAMLAWTPGGTEVQWDVQYGLDGFLLGSGTMANGVVLGPDTTIIGLTSSTDYDWYVRGVCDVIAPFDSVSFWLGPQSFATSQLCSDPSAQDTVNTDPFNAGLTWSPGGLESEWNIQWGETGFPLSGTGSNPINGATITPQNISGLTPETTYDFYVQSVCGSTADSMSTWVGPFTWTQPILCVDPSAGSFFDLGPDSVSFSWTAGGSETNWTVEYGLNGFVLGTGTQIASTNNSVSVNGLTPDTEYCFYVQANCGSTADSVSFWVGPFCTFTESSCPQPTNLSVLNVTNGAANLIWQVGGTETAWNVEWGLPGFLPGVSQETGTIAGTAANPYYVTSLNGSVPYEFYVQAECSAGDTSLWSGPFAFSTQLTNDDPCDAIKLTIDGPAVLHHNIGGTDNGEGTISPAVGPCDDNMSWCADAIANNPVWFKFTAPSNGAVQISTDNSFTDDAGSRTEIALYSVGGCGNYNAFSLLGANTDLVNFQTGSELTLCSLIPGTEYFVMVDGWSDIGAFTPILGFQGNFGIEVRSVDTTPNAGTAVPSSVCLGDTTTFDLFTTIVGNSSTNGTWYNPTVAPGNEFSNLLDISGALIGSYPFFYVDGSPCGADTVLTTITIETGPVAGGDGTVTSCNTKDIILIQELTGSVELGGTWIDNDGTGALGNGIFESFGTPAGTYTFIYVVAGGSGSCPDDSATVTVTLTDCLGIGEEGTTALAVFPNPVVDVLTIQNLDIAESVIIDILDIQGKVVMSEQMSDIKGNYDVNMSKIESGVYVVRITTDEMTQEVRVLRL